MARGVRRSRDYITSRITAAVGRRVTTLTEAAGVPPMASIVMPWCDGMKTPTLAVVVFVVLSVLVVPGGAATCSR